MIHVKGGILNLRNFKNSVSFAVPQTTLSLNYDVSAAFKLPKLFDHFV
jgi:hypothetical protein